jgi:hypothetical protein
MTQRPAVAVCAALFLMGCGARSDLPGEAPAVPGAAASVLLFGGISGDADAGYPELSDTWLWTASGGWSELHPEDAPSPRSDAMTATLAGDTVLFGGDAPVAETWSFNGKTWSQRKPSASPPALTDAIFVPFGQGLTLFGGYDDGVLYWDVWSWDGADWTHASPSTMPPASEAPAGAVVGGEVVIFGGEGIDFEPLGDTWAYDGTSWTQLSPAHSPSPRRGAVAAAYDGKMVLFGGDVISPSTQDWLSLDETWVWDGTDWTQQHPSQSPPPRSFAAMASAGGKVVLFGGANFGGSFTDPAGTWTWDGTSWIEETGPGPGPRNGPTMAAR